MKKYYRILKIESSNEPSQGEEAALGRVNTFGPPFESKDQGKDWLKENAEEGNEYIFSRFYSLNVPAGIVAEEKKSKEKKEQPGQ